ncbi:MAG: hypothetical protein GWN12_19515, partial [Thermoplasmata archaeon]|nr:hypothetical protein [Thermoplasmata archaeon]
MDQYGEPVTNETVRLVVTDWAGNERLNTTNKTNSAGIANASYNLNGVNYWGFWNVNATAGNLTHTTRFISNWWGCANCHPSRDLSLLTNPPYSRSPYVMGLEGD